MDWIISINCQNGWPYRMLSEYTLMTAAKFDSVVMIGQGAYNVTMLYVYMSTENILWMYLKSGRS